MNTPRAGLTNVWAERYDAGVRIGGALVQGMIVVPVEPDMRMAVVGAPSYSQTSAKWRKSGNTRRSGQFRGSGRCGSDPPAKIAVAANGRIRR
jgi:hypothetical protein